MKTIGDRFVYHKVLDNLWLPAGRGLRVFISDRQTILTDGFYGYVVVSDIL
ncbi:MAG: hypothetical protein NZ901_09695 [Geminocystis sp.]|nr:hypothetical protein [Geminocystis sp.]MCS7148446.1 hypothetical protein [Geminocystis sp.]MDW8463691.1 hypothetical protein [Geminocystis sp.]